MAAPAPVINPEYPARRHYQQEGVAAEYDRRRFTSWFGRNSDRREKLALRRAMAHLPDGSTVLELACGTGRMTEVATAAGFRIVGLDISQAMLRGAVQRIGGEPYLMGFVRGQSESMPLRDGSVDAVMSYRFLPHLPEPTRRTVFREIHRVTRRFAVLQYSTTRSLLFWLRRARETITGKRKRRGMTHRAILRELRQAGFREIATVAALAGIGESHVVVVERVAPEPAPSP
jgi:ubiquinone/menaquinone biosynthesis C-methylase UbiE